MAKFSILTNNLEKCMMKNGDCIGRVERHHCMNGADRKKSDKYGLIAPLCTGHHTLLPDAVHRSRASMDRFKGKSQIAFEEHHPDLDWFKIFGQNYKHKLEDDQNESRSKSMDPMHRIW